MLNIRNVKHSDAGDYECQVTSDFLNVFLWSLFENDLLEKMKKLSRSTQTRC